MLEWTMLLGIGFLAGCLLTVTFIPLIHERAVRLTARRYQALTPLSVAEMEAQKDLLRAEFAMSIRRLEMVVEETKAKAALHLGEIGRKVAEIHRLKAELAKGAAPAVPSRIRMALLKGGMERERHDAA